MTETAAKLLPHCCQACSMTETVAKLLPCMQYDQDCCPTAAAQTLAEGHTWGRAAPGTATAGAGCVLGRRPCGRGASGAGATHHSCRIWPAARLLSAAPQRRQAYDRRLLRHRCQICNMARTAAHCCYCRQTCNLTIDCCPLLLHRRWQKGRTPETKSAGWTDADDAFSAPARMNQLALASFKGHMELSACNARDDASW